MLQFEVDGTGAVDRTTLADRAADEKKNAPWLTVDWTNYAVRLVTCRSTCST